MATNSDPFDSQPGDVEVDSPPGSPLAVPLPPEEPDNEDLETVACGSTPKAMPPEKEVDLPSVSGLNSVDNQVCEEGRDLPFGRKMAIHLIGHIRKKTDNLHFGRRCTRLMKRKNIRPSPIAVNLFGGTKDLSDNYGVSTLDCGLKYPDISHLLMPVQPKSPTKSPVMYPPRRKSKIGSVERFCVLCCPERKRADAVKLRCDQEKELDVLYGQVSKLVSSLGELQSKILGCEDWDWAQEVSDFVHDMNTEIACKSHRKRPRSWKLTEYCPKRKRKCCRGKNLKLNRVKKGRTQSILHTLLTEPVTCDSNLPVTIMEADEVSVTPPIQETCAESDTTLLSSQSSTSSVASENECWAHTTCNLKDLSCQVRRFIRGSELEPSVFRQICGQRFLDCAKVKDLTERLDEAGVLFDFMSLFSMLAEGTFNPRNISFLMLMDTVRLFRAKSTTGMRYREEIKEFFDVLYLESNGCTMRTISGPKHAGSVKGSLHQRGHFPGASSASNWAVPSRPNLRKKNCLAARVQPGLIEESFKILDSGKNYFIAVDGKTVNRGLAGTSDGDIDMWGFEGAPSKESNLKRLNRELQSLDECQQNPSPEGLRHILQMLAFRLKLLREKVAAWYRFRAEKQKQERKNPDNKDKYQYAISCANTALYELKSIIQEILKLNDDICFCLAEYNSALGSYSMCGSVEFDSQPNARFLLDPDSLSEHYNLDVDTHFIQQGTEKWKEIRKTAFVTGSSLHKALMLGAAKGAKRDYNRHFQEFVLKEEPAPFSPEVQMRMEHGRNHEKDAVATLVGKVIPALLPPCAVFLEVGPVLIAGKNVSPLLEVSADGLISSTECAEACAEAEPHAPPQCAVEIKCPFPRGKGEVQVYYQLPYYYVCQVLSEMFAHSAQKLLFLCYSEESTVVMEATFDENLFDRITALASAYYDEEHPVKLKKIPPECAQLSSDLKKYCEEKCTLLAEVKSCSGTKGSIQGDASLSPYSFPKEVSLTISADELPDRVQESIELAKTLVNRSFQALRRKASEMLMFMACNSDREHTIHMPLHIPLGYALAPKGFKMETARKMLDKVKNACKNHDINVIGVSTDGQWGQFCTRSRLGQPLSKLQMVKDTWAKVSKLGRQVLFGILDDVSLLPRSALGQLSQAVKLQSGEVNFENCVVSFGTREISVECPSSGWKLVRIPSLIVQSKGGIFDREGFLSNFFTKPHLCGGQVPVQEEGLLQEEEDSRPFILAVLEELQKLNTPKWGHIGEEEFRETYLTSTRSLGKLLVVELKIFHRVCKVQRNKSLFMQTFKKKDMVLAAARLLRIKVENVEVPTLQTQARAVVLHKLSDLTLQVCVAKALFVLEKEKWIRKCPVPVKIPIGGGGMYEVYSYPEVDPRTGEMEFFVVDPTHILTNLRSHVLRRGFPGLADKAAFVSVCEKTPNILSPAIVKEMVDKQNAEIAMRVFSSEVQQEMVKAGEITTARFVETVRGWYEACDRRGILPDDRVKKMIDMQELLLQRSPVEKFPPDMKYVSGITVQTFEALLCNISQRIIMYHARKESYNQRAWSTLSVESFFSTVTSYTKTGCPRASEVSKIIGDTVSINAVKHNPSKSFYFVPGASATYPAPLADENGDQAVIAAENKKSFFPVHSFDLKSTGKRRKKKCDVTSSAAPLRGVRPIRAKYFKCDESNILPTVRHGITAEDLQRVVDEEM